MIGQTLGHYRVGEQLGRGGMGEVYVADDLNLNRKVALKFLPEAFAADPERMARFEREAKLLASLNHPNIAAIYGLEQAEGKRFLVLELVEGETLAQRLSKGALPIDEALGICRQIAEGLEAAHEKGVIHRDLKPANIMITEGDKVNILDFGLAKALSDDTQSIDSSQSPTLTEAMTRPGVILGTAAYMSPEQAKGKSVDKRADIWAFGCILYECLAGKKAFEGETVTETLAALLKSEPDWQMLPAATPPGIRTLLRRCLKRDLPRRLHDAADIRIEIDEAFTSPMSEPARARTSRTLMAALVGIGLAAGWGFSYLWTRAGPGPVTAAAPSMTHIEAPAGALSAFHHGFALSPDGRTLIFSARGADGRRQLWERRLDQARPRPIAGTDGGMYPFWSPDGRHFAFLVPGELRRMPAGGGQVQTVCPVPGVFRYGSWGDSGEILFSEVRGSGGQIFRVPAHGGTPAAVPGLGGGMALLPQWLPGSRHFLFCKSEGNNQGHIFAAAVDGSSPPKPLAEIGSPGVTPAFLFSPTGHLFFNRSGALFVRRFDLKSLSLVGPPIAIAGLVGTPSNWFSITAAGDAVAMRARESADDTGNPGDPLARLKWFDRQGEIVGNLGPPGRYWTQRLSPDGLRAAVNPDSDLWILEAGKPRKRVTSQPNVEYSAVWSPDGKRIAFISGFGRLKVANLGGGEIELPNKTAGWFIPTDWLQGGMYLLLNAVSVSRQNSTDIWVYDYSGKSARPWLAKEFAERDARFSPDGRWVAYSSNATGPFEVYLRPFEGEGDAIAVSPAGGRHPAWRRDGRELFYLSPGNEMMAVRVTHRGASIETGEPQRLFKVQINDITVEQWPYDVAPDGQRFLINVPEPPEPLLFIQGFAALLNKGQ